MSLGYISYPLLSPPPSEFQEICNYQKKYPRFPNWILQGIGLDVPTGLRPLHYFTSCLMEIIFEIVFLPTCNSGLDEDRTHNLRLKFHGPR